MTKQAFDLYQDITDRIIASIEEGVIPWRKPWDPNSGYCGLPQNAVSKRTYGGVNVLLLWQQEMKHGYKHSKWLSFKNITEMGGNVRKGEKATRIMFWKPMVRDKTDANGNVIFNDDGEAVQEHFGITKAFNVFNIEQCEGLPEQLYKNPIHLKPLEAYQAVECVQHIVKGMDVGLQMGQSNSAFYSPREDKICLPAVGAFFSEEDFAATLLHELTHATGAEYRLNRIGITSASRKNKEQYAFEELVAELGSAFCGASLGLTTVFENHASYIDHWLKVLKSDKKAIFQAAKLAREATEYMLERRSLEENMKESA